LDEEKFRDMLRDGTERSKAEAIATLVTKG
jgi:hypothetical protein